MLFLDFAPPLFILFLPWCNLSLSHDVEFPDLLIGHQLRTPLPWRCWRNPAAMQNCKVRPRWVQKKRVVVRGLVATCFPQLSTEIATGPNSFQKTEIAIVHKYDWLGWLDWNICPFWMAYILSLWKGGQFWGVFHMHVKTHTERPHDTWRILWWPQLQTPNISQHWMDYRQGVDKHLQQLQLLHPVTLSYFII